MEKAVGEIGWGAPIAVQVVVVLTAEWTVLCYDHQLKLLWESNPTDHRVAGTVHREVLSVSLRTAPRVPVACSIGPDYPRGSDRRGCRSIPARRTSAVRAMLATI